jgi:hypothetical protein
MRISTLILLVLLSACSHSTKSFHDKKDIVIDSIDFVYIKKNQIDNDSIRLNLDQTRIFVCEWNASKPTGLSKFRPEYWIIAKMTNGTIRTFRANRNNIKENDDFSFIIEDSLLFSTFYEYHKNPFLKPEQFNPLSFLKAVSYNNRPIARSLRIPITMFDDFPRDWVKKEHIDTLISFLDSKDTCCCFLNPLSSYIPSDYALKAGYAALFIEAYRNNESVKLGLHSCPKIDTQLNKELIDWWNKEKNK